MGFGLGAKVRGFMHAVRFAILKQPLRDIVTSYRSAALNFKQNSTEQLEKARTIAKIRLGAAKVFEVAKWKEHPFDAKFHWVPFQMLNEEFRSNIFGDEEGTDFMGHEIVPPLLPPMFTKAYQMEIIEIAKTRHSLEELDDLERQIKRYASENGSTEQKELSN